MAASVGPADKTHYACFNWPSISWLYRSYITSLTRAMQHRFTIRDLAFDISAEMASLAARVCISTLRKVAFPSGGV